MSKMVEIDWRPDERTLRQFGFIALFGFGFVATIAWFERLVFASLIDLGQARLVVTSIFAGLAVLSASFSLLAPRANLPIYLGLTLVAYPIGFVISHAIMAFLFFGMITPLGLLFRLIGKDPLQRSLDPSAETYWAEPRPRRSKDSYFRQF